MAFTPRRTEFVHHKDGTTTMTELDADGNPLPLETSSLAPSPWGKAKRKYRPETRSTVATKTTAENRMAVLKQADYIQRLDGPSISASVDEAMLHPNGKRGWRSFGEFALAVRRVRGGGAGGGDGIWDDRLVRAASTFGSELVGSEGGFAIPPGFQSDMLDVLVRPTAIVARTAQVVTATGDFTTPTDESTPWGSSGVRMVWEGEGDTLAQVKPNLKKSTLKLHKLVAFVPMTDELVEDTPSLDSYLREKISTALDYELARVIVNGTGAGQPVGILSSNALITVAKTSSQDADSIVGQNCVDMWARLAPGAASSAVWLVNPNTMSEIVTMSLLGQDSTGTPETGWGIPLFVPSSTGGAGTILGAPVLPTSACSTLGDVGDIILAGLKQYRTVTKAGGLQVVSSSHFYFSSGHNAFRLTIRFGGSPLLSAPISPRTGATLSPFITLAERS